MNDKEIMTNLLNSVKGECDLLMHGAIESSTPNVHNALKQSLDDALCMQSRIYAKMSEKGWYPAQQAQGTQIDAVKQKFANQQN
ncbi:MAG: spore coat protein [Clostridia bacterium]|nr:spore coat protein [Clostridia bacterium]